MGALACGARSRRCLIFIPERPPYAEESQPRGRNLQPFLVQLAPLDADNRGNVVQVARGLAILVRTQLGSYDRSRRDVGGPAHFVERQVETLGNHGPQFGFVGHVKVCLDVIVEVNDVEEAACQGVAHGYLVDVIMGFMQTAGEQGYGEVVRAEQDVHVLREARLAVCSNGQAAPDSVAGANGFQDVDDATESLDQIT